MTSQADPVCMYVSLCFRVPGILHPLPSLTEGLANPSTSGAPGASLPYSRQVPVVGEWMEEMVLPLTQLLFYCSSAISPEPANYPSFLSERGARL